MLPDESRSPIPAAWTDLADVGPSCTPRATLASLADWVRARAIVDALQGRLPPAPSTTAGAAGSESAATAAGGRRRTGKLACESDSRPRMKQS